MCGICNVPESEKKEDRKGLCLVEMDDGTLIEMCIDCEQDIDEYHSVIRTTMVQNLGRKPQASVRGFLPRDYIGDMI